MNSLNKAEIIGNLTRVPELKTTKGGQSVSTIGVATNRRWKDGSGEQREETEYHNIVVWGKLAEICCQYLSKGSKVFFSGRLQTRNWEDDAGIKHYRTEIVAEDMIMLSSKRDSQGGGGSSYNSDPGPSSYSAPAAAPAPMDNISPDDLPF